MNSPEEVDGIASQEFLPRFMIARMGNFMAEEGLVPIGQLNILSSMLNVKL